MPATSIYKETAVTTQNSGRIIVMLYEGAIKFLRQAAMEMENGNYQAKNTLLLKAQDILFELNTSLDMEVGGEIAQNLRQLYNFCWQQISQANVRNDIEMVHNVINILKELHSGWKQISS